MESFPQTHKLCLRQALVATLQGSPVRNEREGPRNHDRRETKATWRHTQCGTPERQRVTEKLGNLYRACSNLTKNIAWNRFCLLLKTHSAEHPSSMRHSSDISTLFPSAALQPPLTRDTNIILLQMSPLLQVPPGGVSLSTHGRRESH